MYVEKIMQFSKNITNGDVVRYVGGYVVFHVYQSTFQLVKSYSKFVGEYDHVICDEVGDAKGHFRGVAKCCVDVWF